MKTYPFPESTKALLTEHSISPSVFTSGDTVNVKFTLQNTLGLRLIRYAVRFGYMKKNEFEGLFDVGAGVANMASRAIKTFEHDVCVTGDSMEGLITSMRKAGDRARNGFVLAVTVTDSKMNETVDYYPVDLSCVIMNRRYCPDVPTLMLERCDEDGNILDSGERMAITAKIANQKSPADGLFSCKLYYAVGHIPTAGDNCIDLSDCIAAMKDGVEKDSTMIDTVFDNSSDWFFALVYGDEFETAQASFTVAQSFTNMHEAGFATGGVRFGGYSRSKMDKPFFESDYPGYFYGGLANIQGAVIPAIGMTGAGNCNDIDVTFPRPFAEGTVPVVIVGFQSASTASMFGRCTVAVLPESVTNEGFTMRFFNGDNAARNPAYSYIALGIPAPAV